MKRILALPALCALLLALAGCGPKLPAAAADGEPWSEDWTMVGQKLGVEGPGEAFTLQDVKGSKNLYFTAWSAGEAQTHTDSEGEEVQVYDAQVVVLLSDKGSDEAAQADVDELLSLAEGSYTLSATAQETHNGQDFTVLTYTFPSGSAYAQGASAFTVYDGCAVSVEVACQDAFTPPPADILSDFLDHCHYAPLS